MLSPHRFALLLCVIAFPSGAPAQAQPAAAIGWYNGDWQSGIPGQPNWYFSASQFSRVYDDFVVPEGGWTIVAVFSDNRMNFTGLTKASWEIRKNMAPGKEGKKVASGVSRATQIPLPGQAPNAGNDWSGGYRIQVDNIRVRLAPGRYWLNVAPAVGKGLSYANATVGKNAVGDPPGNNGNALVLKPALGVFFADAEQISPAGKYGKARDFSQGVIVDTSGK